MRVGLATDHGGFHLKEDMARRLRAAGHEVTDFGAHAFAPDDDYPDFVTPLGRALIEGQVERGVAFCCACGSSGNPARGGGLDVRGRGARGGGARGEGRS